MPQQSNPNQTYPNLPKSSLKSWLWFILGVIFLGIVISFSAAVFMEVNQRNQEVKDLLGLRSGADNNISNDLINQLKNNFSASSSTNAIADNPADSASQNNASFSQERLLAEKINRPYLGNVSSSVVIVEFIDFECPISLETYPIIRTLTNKYEQDILFIIRNYPIKSENSQMLAAAGFCAQEQGKFWQLHDKLFMSQGKLTSLEDFKAVTVSAGVNWVKLQECINSEKYRNLIIEDMADALDLGVRGTPTFFVNGNKLEGVVSLATWEEIIKKAKELNK